MFYGKNRVNCLIGLVWKSSLKSAGLFRLKIGLSSAQVLLNYCS